MSVCGFKLEVFIAFSKCFLELISIPNQMCLCMETLRLSSHGRLYKMDYNSNFFFLEKRDERIFTVLKILKVKVRA